MSEHKSSKKRSRSRRVGTVLLTVLVALGLVAAAAVYLGKAGVQGSVSSAAFEPQWTEASISGATTAYPTVMSTCQATRNANGTITVTASEAYPGESCIVSGKIALRAAGQSTTTGKVTGIRLPGLPSGWSAALYSDAYCGLTVPRLPASADVSFVITMSDQAAVDGASATFLNGAGLEVSPSSQVSGTPTCSTYQGGQ